MAGGGTSNLDLVLYLIGRFVGLQEALDSAKAYLIEWHEAGQQPYASLLASRDVSDAVIARCREWAAEHYTDGSPVAAMTKLSGLPERTFIRRFSQGHRTVAAGLRAFGAARGGQADAGDRGHPVEAIALEVGYEDASFFNRLFRRKVGLTLAQYRRRFGSLKRNLPPLSPSPLAR